MKKFKFTLQTVHNVRQMRQEKEQLLLGQLQFEMNQISEQIEQIKQMRETAIENYHLRLKPGQAINPAEIEMETGNIAYLKRRLEEAEKSLEAKKEECLKQTEKVVLASRDVKITERLREKQNARHNLELSRLEQNLLDEMATSSFARHIPKK